MSLIVFVAGAFWAQKRIVSVLFNQLGLGLSKTGDPFFDFVRGFSNELFVSLDQICLVSSSHQVKLLGADQILDTYVSMASFWVSKLVEILEQVLALQPLITVWIIEVTVNSESFPESQLHSQVLILCVHKLVDLLIQTLTKLDLEVIKPDL